MSSTADPSAPSHRNSDTTSPLHDNELNLVPSPSPGTGAGAGAATEAAARDPSPFTENEMHRTTSRTARHARNERRASRGSVDYDIPESYRNLDEVNAQPPVQNPDEESVRHSIAREDDTYSYTGSGNTSGRRGSRGSRDGTALTSERSRRLSQASATQREARMLRRRRSAAGRVDYDIPDVYTNLDEVASVSPVQNPDEEAIYQHESLEDKRSRDQEYKHEQDLQRHQTREEALLPPQQESPRDKLDVEEPPREFHVSRLATQIYTISYLVLFSLFGTLARLGLQTLTNYPGAPVIFSSLWPNFGGSLFMGFLAEDRMLFRHEWGTPTYERQLQKARDEEGGAAVDIAAAKKAYLATKKTIPLYIGLATGFCGSFTSFSSFIRDIFLALSNDLQTPGVAVTAHRNGGYSFMALVAVALVTVSMSLCGLFIGAHLAITFEPYTPSLPYLFTRKIIDRLAVFLAWGSWLGAVLLSVLPPDRSNGGTEIWRGRATFALVFAPLGCLARFYASLYLNGRIASFPLGTFAVNVFGTGILGMCWDLAHVPLGGIVGCQVLQGVEDGFCGCLTTVSTWVAELAALRRRHAYFYGMSSVVAGLCVLVAVMGGLRWSDGFATLLCAH